MKRKEFISSTCKLGLCSCIPFSFFSSHEMFAKTDKDSNNDWKIGFMQKRIAKFIENIDSADKEKKIQIIESIGKACAGENISFFNKYKGAPDEALNEIKKKWADKTEYNKEEKFIRITGKKKDSCGCPFVDDSIMPKEFCYCASGYFKEAFETILDNPVEVKIEESVLFGDEKCTHLINII